MICIAYQEFARHASRANLVPIYAELPADLDTPLTAFLKIQTGDHDFLLESVEGGEQWGRYSVLGTKPVAILRSKGSVVEIVRGNAIESMPVKDDPLTVVKQYMTQFKPVLLPGLPRFSGGAVGFLAYDMVRFFEKVPCAGRDELKLYDAYFLITETLIVFDNLKQCLLVIANVHLDGKRTTRAAYDDGVKKINAIVRKLRRTLPRRPAPRYGSIKLKPRHSEAEFARMVRQVKRYITAGDVFQTVVSTRFEGRARIRALDLYRSLRRLNPSPYLYLLQFQDMALVGSSPEVMVRLDRGRVELRPIAGTRRRGRDQRDEIKMEGELTSDPKEMAEHLMLVDLGRNDLGRVCAIPTVKVDEFAVIEKYSHVMHIVSHVSGCLKKGCDAFDVLRATFPAGTLSGAPKVRAMQIIDELEGLRRGLYGGCVGYIGFDGNMDMAITIRTALLKQGKVYIQAGAGIVYNSIPKREYLECQNKAMGLIRALQALGR